MLVERAVKFPKPMADLHLSMCTHHPLPSEYHQPVLGNILLYGSHCFWLHLSPEINSIYFHSKEWQRSEIVSTMDDWGLLHSGGPALGVSIVLVWCNLETIPVCCSLRCSYGTRHTAGFMKKKMPSHAEIHNCIVITHLTLKSLQRRDKNI